MGYESKIYIVEKTNTKLKDKSYAPIIAVFELGKVYKISDVLRNKPATDCYVYADDGDTQIVEDRYGEPLTECEIPELIELIRKDIENGSDYRRYFPLLAMLEAMQEHREQWGEVVCLHYGH